jgi:uracil-DNA glycosylase
MKNLLGQIRQCQICSAHLPFEPRPIIQASTKARIAIIGQAPGLKVQQSGTPWHDRSGDELRRWLGVTPDLFYNEQIFALIPMGFCYPGKGKSGDLPPRPECAPAWHEKLWHFMPQVSLTILIGQYAQQHYLKERFSTSLTENVRNYRSFLPDYFPLVHPSPRNQIWQKKNPWFKEEVVAALQERIAQILQ